MTSVFNKICNALPDVKQFYMWRIKQNSAIEICDKNNEKSVVRNIPDSLLKQ